MLPYFHATSVQLTCLLVILWNKSPQQCQLHWSGQSALVCSAGAWWVIHKYASQIQHGLSFAFLPQVFGGDGDSEGKTSFSNYPVSVLVTQSCHHWEAVDLPCYYHSRSLWTWHFSSWRWGEGEGKKYASFGVVSADLTQVYFSKLLYVSVSFYHQGYLWCLECILYPSGYLAHLDLGVVHVIGQFKSTFHQSSSLSSHVILHVVHLAFKFWLLNS